MRFEHTPFDSFLVASRVDLPFSARRLRCHAHSRLRSCLNHTIAFIPHSASPRVMPYSCAFLCRIDEGWALHSLSAWVSLKSRRRWVRDEKVERFWVKHPNVGIESPDECERGEE